MIWHMDQRWQDLARDLGGSFSARARGLVSPELVLLTAEGEPFGDLTTGEDGSAHLRAGDLAARIESRPGGAYRMTTADEETLTAEPAGSATRLTLRSAGRVYEARLSLLRNRATAGSSADDEAVRVSGGLTNRRYRSAFDLDDPTSLPVAIFLVDRLINLRTRAYRTQG